MFMLFRRGEIEGVLIVFNESNKSGTGIPDLFAVAGCYTRDFLPVLLP